MKVIKLELQEMPNSFSRPVVERLRYPQINPVAINELETIDYSQTMTVTKELYPLQQLRLGKYEEWFYIREQDMKAFLALVDGFVKQGKLELIESLKNYMNKPKLLKGAILEHEKLLTN